MNLVPTLLLCSGEWVIHITAFTANVEERMAFNKNSSTILEVSESSADVGSMGWFNASAAVTNMECTHHQGEGLRRC
jgi:hypothetical protein